MNDHFLYALLESDRTTAHPPSVCCLPITPLSILSGPLAFLLLALCQDVNQVRDGLFNKKYVILGMPLLQHCLDALEGGGEGGVQVVQDEVARVQLSLIFEDRLVNRYLGECLLLR